jgi:uncharacterized integral membrane protein
MSRIKMIIIFIIILLLTIVILQNQNAITLRFLFWDIEMSVFAIPIIVILSIIIGYLIATIRMHRHKKG